MSAVTKLMTPGGGGVSLTPASSIASDVTVNVPSQNCTLGIQGPAFSAYSTAAVIVSVSTDTKLTTDTERFDTNNNYSLSRFTPTIEGYYQINAQAFFDTYSSGGVQVLIYKNSLFYVGGTTQPANSSGTTANSVASSVVYLNGSTDYVEIYASQTSAGPKNVTLRDFSGCLVRAA